LPWAIVCLTHPPAKVTEVVGASRQGAERIEKQEDIMPPLRKQVIGEPTPVQSARTDVSWLDLGSIAAVELSSEDPRFPFDTVLEEGGAQPGRQTIRLRFDRPQSIHRVRLRFVDREHERSQEFVLRYIPADGTGAREIVRQQWNFSPGGSTEEVEDYTLNLERVAVLELEIDPDRGRNTLPATLAELMLA
jgi:hypothetical protein